MGLWDGHVVLGDGDDDDDDDDDDRYENDDY